MLIAYEQYGDPLKWRQIYEANKDKITDPNHVPPGTQLKLNKDMMHPADQPSGTKIKIRHGDTLGKISQRVYGSPGQWKKLWKHNSGLVKDPNKIYAGFFLYYEPSDAAGDGAQQDASAGNQGKQQGQQQPAMNDPGAAPAQDPNQPGAAAPAPAGGSAYPVPQFGFSDANGAPPPPPGP
jgi:hypothetical protein